MPRAVRRNPSFEREACEAICRLGSERPLWQNSGDCSSLLMLPMLLKSDQTSPPGP